MGNMDGFDRTSGDEKLPPPDAPDRSWPRWKIALALITVALILIVGIAI